ncbi:DUF2975 domain-containing protein [Glutamicibacter sp. NPDC087673]|uniref:DUF2975 domain-containing protein n=1 Tax=Glutamicibacter sp. NPDC087673 TaxID=3363997 RepID=UPI003809B97F
MTSLAVISARTAIIAIFLGALLVQVLILPMFIEEAIYIHPEVAHLAIPYRCAVTAGLIGLQMALICFWILASKLRRRTIYQVSSLHWFSIAICAAAAATLLVLGLGIHLLAFIGAGGPGVAFAVAGGAALGGAATCLLVALRGMLVSRIRKLTA